METLVDYILQDTLLKASDASLIQQIRINGVRCFETGELVPPEKLRDTVRQNLKNSRYPLMLREMFSLNKGAL